MKHTKTLTPEMESLKAKLKATWMAGDFGLIAETYAPVYRALRRP